MRDFPRILCPIDFSDASRHALGHAVAIAKWYTSQLIALHVQAPLHLPQPPILFAEFGSSGSAAVPDRETRADDLRAWLEPAHQAGLKTRVIVDHGNPAARIAERARSEDASLIVMGTHGLGGFERFILGSVAERVLRKAACPVMTVPPASETTAKVPYTRVLCPVDFSESSRAAVGLAFSLAEESDARLTLLHVIDWPYDDEMLSGYVDKPEFRQAVEERARERLDALVTSEMKTWSKPRTKLDYGKPYRQILACAASEESDVIVMGVRGRNAVDVTIFGSTTNHVIRQAQCPVLTARQ